MVSRRLRMKTNIGVSESQRGLRIYCSRKTMP